MDTSTLKYFITVAQTQHMSRAAQLLNITQPSLSTSIRRLEADIGFQLFDRVGRGIRLNEYGEIFLKGVTAAQSILADSLADMEALKRASASFVRLACSNSPANSRLIDLLLSKGMGLKVDHIPNAWEQELLNRNCDLVITMGVLHHGSISGVILRSQRLAVVCCKDHPLAKPASVTLDELNHYAFCSTNAPHSLINVVREQCPEYDFHPHIAFLGRNSDDMLKAIRSGIYIGLMVEQNLPAEEELTVLKIKDFDITLPLYLYWRESDEASPAVAAMRQSIIRFYGELGDTYEN